MKVYVVIQLIELENGYRQFKVLGAYSKKSLAEKIAYSANDFLEYAPNTLNCLYPFSSSIN